MARDGLLPIGLARVGRRGVPGAVTIATGVLAALIAGFLPLKAIAELANAGTLAAFIATAVSMLTLRRRAPDLTRPFHCPAPWLVGPLAIAGCLYLFASLPAVTIVWFLAWNAFGLVVYLAWSRRRSVLARA